MTTWVILHTCCRPPCCRPPCCCQGEYQLLEHLGSGASGTAYKARHISGALVCVKTVRCHGRGAALQAEMQRCQREVAVLAALRHPNIIR